MANIRCQMCGKDNEEHLEECQHCGARLKPLIAPHMRQEDAAPESPEPEETRGEESEWLRSLRGDEGDDLEEESEEEEEIDFISQMRGGDDLIDTGDLDEEEDDHPEDTYGDLPEWLAGEEDIISEVKDEGGVPEDDFDLPGFETEGLEEDLPDWLTEMGEAEAEEEAPEAEFDFQGLEPEGAEEGAGPPDWLSELGDDQEEFEFTGEPEEPAQGEGAQDWMADFGEADEEEPEAEFDFQGLEPEGAEEGAESPDWLSELGDDQEEFEFTGEPEEPAQGEEAPDWMADFGESEEEAPEAEFDFQEGVPGGQADEEAIPDWLDEFAETEIGAEEPSEMEFEPSEEAPEEELPDWLGEIGELDVEGPSVPPSELVSETPAGDEKEPDWLDDFGAEGEEIEEEIGAEIEEVTDSTPEWLADLESEESDREISRPLTTGMLDGEHIDEDLLESTAEGQVPDWLQELEGESLEIPIETEGEGEWRPGEEVATWEVEHPPGAPAPEVEGEREADEGLEDLPEWLQAGMETKRTTEPDTGEGELAPGEIPEWVAAMRPSSKPFETRIANEKEEGEVERAGPLAGLRDVLPAEPEIAKTVTPPAYSIKLQVSEVQQRNAKLLLGMLAAEDAPGSVPKPQVLTQQRILRWVIGLGLFLAVLLPILAETQIAPMPTLPPETDAVENLIVGLDENAPVLLAFDYEPGTSGELDAAAASVVDQLMEKNAFITLVSTSPMGPALGERFLRDVQLSHNYEYASDYANLGYISGGAAGLLNFAIAPQETVFLPYDSRFIMELIDLQANDAWALPPLENIEELSDFDLTLVITDDPDVARNWVEQVEPALRSDSFVLVVSAQAEPLVRPYFETPQRQVNGLVTGLAGGAAYEQARGQMHLGRVYWDAFGVSLVVAQVLILIGGIYNLGTALFNRGRGTDEKQS